MTYMEAWKLMGPNLPIDTDERREAYLLMFGAVKAMSEKEEQQDFDKTEPELRRLLSLATPGQKYLIIGFIRGLLGGRGNG